MHKNSVLSHARKNKNNEFYTTFEFAKKEIGEYGDRGLFKDKVIYCPCDNPCWSNILRALIENRIKWGIKYIYCSYFTGCERSNIFVVHNRETRLNIVYNTSNEILKTIIDKGWNIPSGTFIDCIEPECFSLHFNGDFRSSESSAISRLSDIIITNPPFTCRDFNYSAFLDFCVSSGKKFLVLGSNVAVSTKGVFSLYKNCSFRGGYNCDTSELFYTSEKMDKEHSSKVPVTWYTNLPVFKNNEPYHSGKLFKDIKHNWYWDRKKCQYIVDSNNGERILYLKTYKDYPDDYCGIVGIPTNSFYRFNPKYFDILYPHMNYGVDVRLESGQISKVSMRIFIRRKNVYIE